MVILITGDKNIGKTTIINNICNLYKNEIIGLETKEYFKNNKRQGFYMTKLFSDEKPIETNIIAVMNNDFKPIVNEETFENLGVNLLNEMLLSNKRISIIDEIGVFERNCKNYVEKLYTILNQKNKIVICVISNKDHNFLHEIKKNREVMTVNIQNRNEISTKLIEYLKMP